MDFIDGTTGAKTLNTDLFTADLKSPAPNLTNVERGGFFKVLVSLAAGAKVNVTLDGTNYTALNSGTALTADVLYEFNIPTRGSDVLNIQLDTSVTVDILNVFYFD